MPSARNEQDWQPSSQSGSEHEVVDQQLTSALERPGKGGRAGRAVEDVVLVNFDHRQRAPLGVQRVSLPREFLLLRQQFPAGGQPLLS